MRTFRLIWAALFLSGIVGGPVARAGATPIVLTYTGDNVVSGFWYLDGSSTFALPLGANAAQWAVADSLTLNLSPGTYQFIWQVYNYEPKDVGNPGGFLASVGTSPLISGSLLSSAAWKVAFPDNPITDFYSTGVSWLTAKEYGANNDPSTFWHVWHYPASGPISGIDGNAKWIWWGINFADPGVPLGQAHPVYLKTTITIAAPAPVPEPSTLGLLGLGIIGLIGCGWRRGVITRLKTQTK